MEKVLYKKIVPKFLCDFNNQLNFWISGQETIDSNDSSVAGNRDHEDKGENGSFLITDQVNIDY